MGSLETAILHLTGVSDSQITPAAVSSALAAVPGGKDTLKSKMEKVSAALSSSAGTRKRKGRKARKTRRH